MSTTAAWVTAEGGFGNNAYIDLLRIDVATGRVTKVAHVSHAGVVSDHPVLGGGSVWLGYARFDASSRLFEQGTCIGQFQLAPMKFIDHSDPTGSSCVSAVAWSQGNLWTLCDSSRYGRIARIRPGTVSSPKITLTASSGLSVLANARPTVDGQGRLWFAGRATGASSATDPHPARPSPCRVPRGPTVAGSRPSGSGCWPRRG